MVTLPKEYSYLDDCETEFDGGMSLEKEIKYIFGAALGVAAVVAGMHQVCATESELITVNETEMYICQMNQTVYGFMTICGIAYTGVCTAAIATNKDLFHTR